MESLKRRKVPPRKEKNHKIPFLEDGLYQVTRDMICAGFIVKNGKITKVAPILKRNLSYFIRFAKKVG